VSSNLVAGRAVTVAAVPRLTLSPEECARSLGVSRNFFDLHVLPELRVVRRGRRRLIPIRELARWVTDSAARALAEAS